MVLWEVVVVAGDDVRWGYAFVSATRWNCCRKMLAGCSMIRGVGGGLDRGDGL